MTSYQRVPQPVALIENIPLFQIEQGHMHKELKSHLPNVEQGEQRFEKNLV
jgi:hypothetical protein